MTTVESSVVINRPVKEVFAFTTDPNKVSQWAGPVIESEQTSDGPIGIGTTSNRVTQLLGRTMNATYEITEFEEYKSYADRTTSGPVPMNGHITFDEVNEGTRVTISGELDAGGFFKLAEPLLARMARRQIALDVQTLKDLLEAQS